MHHPQASRSLASIGGTIAAIAIAATAIAVIAIAFTVLTPGALSHASTACHLEPA